MNQADFALIGGVTRKSQSLYENNERSPDALYLSSIASAGADLHYILTGKQVSVHIPLNIELIRLAIEEVDAALYESDCILPPDKKAQLITSIYDLYHESDKKPEKSKILRLVKLAA